VACAEGNSALLGSDESHPFLPSSAQFGQEDWKKHRSSTRYVRHVSTIFTSRIILNTVKPTAFFAGVAALFALYNTEVPVRVPRRPPRPHDVPIQSSHHKFGLVLPSSLVSRPLLRDVGSSF
jgi:hypothetical protein